MHEVATTKIPRDPTFEATLGMLLEGYDFIWRRCRRLRSDVFRTRVMGRPAVCLHGREAAKLFYDETKMQRRQAMPRRIVSSLFGRDAVHTLDDTAHATRKAAFLSLMTPMSTQRLMDETALQWQLAILRWERAPSVVLFDEALHILTAATCAWAGVPLPFADVKHRADDLAAMVDAFGGFGPRLWKGKLARVRTERWIERMIRDVRSQKLHAEPSTALHVMAHHRDARGRLLSASTAAIELINVIRPTVAVAWYVAFAAHALIEHPEWREKIARRPVEGGVTPADLFMQEVRRYYPFTPYLGAKARVAFDWRGHHFKAGTRVLLDVYGADHDPRLWEAPYEFRPERFRGRRNDVFGFIPQGGGQRTGHRCPGEWITMHNVALALHFLTRCMTYELQPDQDLYIDLTRMPTRPASGVVLCNVRATPALEGPAPSLPSPIATQDSTTAARLGELGSEAQREIAALKSLAAEYRSKPTLEDAS